MTNLTIRAAMDAQHVELEYLLARLLEIQADPTTTNQREMDSLIARTRQAYSNQVNLERAVSDSAAERN